MTCIFMSCVVERMIVSIGQQGIGTKHWISRLPYLWLLVDIQNLHERKEWHSISGLNIFEYGIFFFFFFCANDKTVKDHLLLFLSLSLLPVMIVSINHKDKEYKFKSMINHNDFRGQYIMQQWQILYVYPKKKMIPTFFFEI